MTLPTLYVSFATEKQDTGNSEQFPLYSNVSRDKLLAKVSLRIDGKATAKIIAGVALFLMG